MGVRFAPTYIKIWNERVQQLKHDHLVNYATAWIWNSASNSGVLISLFYNQNQPPQRLSETQS